MRGQGLDPTIIGIGHHGDTYTMGGAATGMRVLDLDDDGAVRSRVIVV